MWFNPFNKTQIFEDFFCFGHFVHTAGVALVVCGSDYLHRLSDIIPKGYGVSEQTSQLFLKQILNLMIILRVIQSKST